MENEILINQLSETEVVVGKNRTQLIGGDIIYVIAVGEQSAELSNAQIEVDFKMAALVPGKVHFLIDLNQCGKNSPDARKAWQEISEHEKTDKVAVFGMHPVARVLASFVIGVTRKKDIRFFVTKEEALAWIRE